MRDFVKVAGNDCFLETRLIDADFYIYYHMTDITLELWAGDWWVVQYYSDGRGGGAVQRWIEVSNKRAGARLVKTTREGMGLYTYSLGEIGEMVREWHETMSMCLGDDGAGREDDGDGWGDDGDGWEGFLTSYQDVARVYERSLSDAIRGIHWGNATLTTADIGRLLMEGAAVGWQRGIVAIESYGCEGALSLGTRWYNENYGGVTS